MAGPASLWIPELSAHGAAAVGALAGLLVARRILRRLGPAAPSVGRRRAVLLGLVVAGLSLLLAGGSGGWAESLAASPWGLQMGLAGVTGLLLGCAAGAAGGYVFDLLDEPDFVRPPPGQVVGGRGAGRGGAAGAAAGASSTRRGPPFSHAATSAQEPTLRPATGTVSAATPGRDADEERAGLLRTLAEGPDFRRGAAAAALALHCAGLRDIEVIAALLAAVRNEEFGTLVRAESLLALYALLGQSLPVEVEVVVRQDFPEGVDWDFVRSCEALVEAGD